MSRGQFHEPKCGGKILPGKISPNFRVNFCQGLTTTKANAKVAYFIQVISIHTRKTIQWTIFVVFKPFNAAKTHSFPFKISECAHTEREKWLLADKLLMQLMQLMQPMLLPLLVLKIPMLLLRMLMIVLMRPIL